MSTPGELAPAEDEPCVIEGTGCSVFDAVAAFGAGGTGPEAMSPATELGTAGEYTCAIDEARAPGPGVAVAVGVGGAEAVCFPPGLASAGEDPCSAGEVRTALGTAATDSAAAATGVLSLTPQLKAAAETCSTVRRLAAVTFGAAAVGATRAPASTDLPTVSSARHTEEA